MYAGDLKAQNENPSFDGRLLKSHTPVTRVKYLLCEISRMKKQLCCPFVFFLFAPLLFAQFETSEVLGTVRDPSGAAVSKARVTLTNRALASRRKPRPMTAATTIS